MTNMVKNAPVHNGMLFITNKIQRNTKITLKVQPMVVPLTHGIQHCFSSLKLYFLSKKFRLLSLTLRFWLMSYHLSSWVNSLTSLYNEKHITEYLATS